MEMQLCIMKSKIVSTAVVGLESWVSGKLNELLESKDDAAWPPVQRHITGVLENTRIF